MLLIEYLFYGRVILISLIEGREKFLSEKR